MKDIYVGQTVYFTRIIPSCDVYDLLDLQLRTVNEEGKWFVGCDKKTKAAFLFYEIDIDNVVFLKRNDALKHIKETKKNRKGKVFTIYCEENS